VSESFPHLESRIAALERRVAPLRGALLLSLAVASGIAATGFARHTDADSGERPPIAVDEIRVRSLLLVDDGGAVRASLRIFPDGPRLELLNEDGVARVQLGHGTEETALYLADGTGTTRVGIAQFRHGGGGLAVHGEASAGATALCMADGRARLTFCGTDGAVAGQVAPPAGWTGEP
jgi:hypothetical protein